MANPQHNQGLTNRERAVVEMICQGKSIQEITELLGVTRYSVRLNMRHVRVKYAVREEVSLYQYFGAGCQDKEGGDRMNEVIRR